MGVDYTPVSGFSIKMSSQDVLIACHKLMLLNEFEDLSELFERLKIAYSNIGSCYTGDTKTIPIFVPKDCVNLDFQLVTWLGELNTKLGLGLTINDVVFVSELYVY